MTRPTERDQVRYPGDSVYQDADGPWIQPMAEGVLHGQASDLGFLIQDNPAEALASLEGQREFNDG